MRENNIEYRVRLLSLLHENPSWIDTLKEALQFHREKDGSGLGFEWFDVHTPPQTLNKMIAEKVLDVTLSTRSATHYKLKDKEIIQEVLSEIEKPQISLKEELPGDLFQIIVGYDNPKELLKLAIHSEKPVHVLISGVAASSKTIFLLELARIPGSYYALGPALTSAGLAELLFTYEPKYLLLDEIDRLSGDNIGVLNSLMATGRIVEVKFRKTRSAYLNTKVFAAGIRTHLLPKDLLSRFVKLKFDPYTEKEFTLVAEKVLVDLEQVPGEEARFIALHVWKMHGENSDVRQAVQIARLSGGKQEKIEEVFRVLRQYGERR